MATKPISALPAAAQVNASDLFVLEQTGEAKKLAGSLLLSTIQAHGGIASSSYTPPVAPSLVGTLTFTYADGTSSTIPVYNGAKGDKGDPGEAGNSPTASISKEGSTATIIITDDNGTTTATITDGEDGEDGAPGFCWIAWASVEPTSDADITDVPSAWLGIYSGNESSAPTSYTAYQWYCIKGAKGDTGDTGDRGTYAWFATASPYDDNDRYYFLRGDLRAPVAGATPRVGDFVLYADTYCLITHVTVAGQCYIDLWHTFNSTAIPAGGAAKYRLVKASGTDYDVEWDSPEVFIATYGETTTSQIESAISDNKVVIVTKESYSETTQLLSRVFYGLDKQNYTYSGSSPFPSATEFTFTFTDESGNVHWATASRGLTLETTWANGIVSGGGGGVPYTSNPEMDGTASPGSASELSRGDHVHPSDTSRQAKITASGILKGDGNGGVTAAVADTDYVATVDSAFNLQSENPVQNKVLSLALQNANTALALKYEKPSGGIPASDLASAVQTSLGLADTALQSYTETDPTVPSWAKASSKPSYTASEVGAVAVSQGVAHFGDFLVVGSDGNVTTVTMTAWQGGSY